MSVRPRSRPPPATKIAVVGASAGGVEALQRMAGALPVGLEHAIVVVLHISPRAHSALPAILARAGPVPAVVAVDGTALEPGVIHVAPPDHHVLVPDGQVCLSLGRREHGHRPAIDPTMRSAAATYGADASGVVLSGAQHDGSDGLAAIRRAGGRVAVQVPHKALHPAMPRNAMRRVAVDAVLELDQIGRWLQGVAILGSPAA
jgi:two-component system chemotaxis response regulator CheB